MRVPLVVAAAVAAVVVTPMLRAFVSVGGVCVWVCQWDAKSAIF